MQGGVRMTSTSTPRQHMAANDCAYFLTTSLPVEFQRKHELQLMNVYYDVLIKESGSDPDKYTWCDPTVQRERQRERETKRERDAAPLRHRRVALTLRAAIWRRDVFCLETQHCMQWFVIIFVFLIPEVISSNEPGADERKKTMVKGFCAVCSPLHTLPTPERTDRI